MFWEGPPPSSRWPDAGAAAAGGAKRGRRGGRGVRGAAAVRGAPGAISIAAGGRAGELRVRLVCLADAEAGGRLDLATVGANARRATEDSSAVGYIEAPGPRGPLLACRSSKKRGSPWSRAAPAPPRWAGCWTRSGPPGRAATCAKRSATNARMPAGRSERSRERVVDVGEAELVAEVERSPRQHPLAAPQHRAELAAEYQVEGEAGHRHHRRAGAGPGRAPWRARGW